MPASRRSLVRQPPRWWQFKRQTAAVLGVSGIALLAVAGCAAGTPPIFPGGTPGAGPAGGPSAGPRTVAVARGGRQRAELQVLSGATTVTVGTAPLGGELARASVPAGAGVRPRLVISGGTVQLFLDSAGGPGPATVQVTLNSAVAWRLGFSGGATLTSVFLGRGQLRGADFAAGSSQVTLRLPRPHGTVPLVLAGGASLVTITAPRGVPSRLRLDGGAGTARLNGQAYTGIAGGTVLTEPGWATAANRYDIEAPAGISVITVGTW